MGLDVVYVGVGAVLSHYGQTTSTNPAIYKGFGRSIVVQGVFLLAFDNIMYAAHQKYNSRWATIIAEISYTGYGLNYTHTFR